MHRTIHEMNHLVIYFMLLFFQCLNGQEMIYNQEFKISTYQAALHSYPAVCDFSDGGFVFCYMSQTIYASRYGIFTQLFDKNGTKTGSEFQVNSQLVSTLVNPSVCVLTNDRFVICWTDNISCYAQLYDRNGNMIGTNFRISERWGVIYAKSSIGALSNGGFVFCWESDEFGTFLDIRAQVFDNDGNKIGEDIKVNDYTPMFQYKPAVCGLMGGGFVVCWESYAQDGDYYGIFAKIYDNTGEKVNDEFQVNSYIANAQSSPSVSSLTNDRFVVCWEGDGKDEGDYGIYAQLFDTTGNKVGEEFTVMPTVYNSWGTASVTGLIDGRFAVCWQNDFPFSLYWEIFARLFDINGNSIGEEFKVKTLSDHWIEGTMCTISRLQDKGFIVGWMDSVADDSRSNGIFAKYYLNDPINHQLSAFSLLEPEFDVKIENIPVSFKWSSASEVRPNIPWEMEYRLYLSENVIFTDLQMFSNIYDTTFVIADLNPGKTYFWKVQAFNTTGDSLWSTDIFRFFLSFADQIEYDHDYNSMTFKLLQNYPNPFNPSTTIEFTLPRSEYIELKVFNTLGKQVATLESKKLNPGSYTYTFNCHHLASGIYYCHLAAREHREVIEMILLK